jgi:4-hydroxy-tetrahydrodipicolinate synthase
MKELTGVIIPILTPTDKNGAVIAPALRAHADFLIEAGVHGFFVGGSAGEGPLLTDKEWQRMLEIMIEHVGDKLPLLAGVQDTSTPRVLERLKVVERLKYPFAVVTPPYYFPCKHVPDQARHFATCIESTSVEIIPYNIPQLTQANVPPETYRELLKRHKVRYIKDSGPDVGQIKAIVQEFGPAGIKVFAGNDFTAVDTMRAGATGYISGSANFVPEILLGIYHASKACDWAKAEQLQRQLTEILNAIVTNGPSWLGAAKHFSAKRSNGKWGLPVPPVSGITPEQLAKTEPLIAKAVALAV